MVRAAIGSFSWQGLSGSVDQLVEHVSRLPDYRYYLQNLDEGDMMRDATEVTSGGGPSRVVIFALTAAAIGSFLMVCAASENVAFVLIFTLIGFVLLFIAVIMAMLGSRMSRAQHTIEELEDTIDLERFTALEKEFESPEDVEEKQKHAEQFIENFFGDYTLLQGGWRA